jgi:hypothetical protein
MADVFAVVLIRFACCGRPLRRWTLALEAAGTAGMSWSCDRCTKMTERIFFLWLWDGNRTGRRPCISAFVSFFRGFYLIELWLVELRICLVHWNERRVTTIMTATTEFGRKARNLATVLPPSLETFFWFSEQEKHNTKKESVPFTSAFAPLQGKNKKPTGPAHFYSFSLSGSETDLLSDRIIFGKILFHFWGNLI